MVILLHIACNNKNVCLFEIESYARAFISECLSRIDDTVRFIKPSISHKIHNFVNFNAIYPNAVFNLYGKKIVR